MFRNPFSYCINIDSLRLTISIVRMESSSIILPYDYSYLFRIVKNVIGNKIMSCPKMLAFKKKKKLDISVASINYTNTIINHFIL